MRALREDRGLTQEDAAKAIGISRKQLIRVELGQANVTLETLVACMRFYRVELQDVFAKGGGAGVKHRGRSLLQEKQRLAVRARGLREERNLTQEEAAERIGLSVIQYGRLERAQANVSLATLVAVAAAFRVKPGELFEGGVRGLGADVDIASVGAAGGDHKLASAAGAEVQQRRSRRRALD